LDHRLIVGELEHAAEQDRHIGEFHPRPLRDAADQPVREIGVGSAEIEVEFDLSRQRRSSYVASAFRAQLATIASRAL
jgi:hypothetical protein